MSEPVITSSLTTSAPPSSKRSKKRNSLSFFSNRNPLHQLENSIGPSDESPPPFLGTNVPASPSSPEGKRRFRDRLSLSKRRFCRESEDLVGPKFPKDIPLPLYLHAAAATSQLHVSEDQGHPPSSTMAPANDFSTSSRFTEASCSTPHFEEVTSQAPDNEPPTSSPFTDASSAPRFEEAYPPVTPPPPSHPPLQKSISLKRFLSRGSEDSSADFDTSISVLMDDISRPSTIYAIPRENSASNRGLIKEFRGPLSELALLPNGSMKLGKSHRAFFELRKERLLWGNGFGSTPIPGRPKHFQQLQQSAEQVNRESFQEYLKLHSRIGRPYRRPFSDPLVIASLHEHQSENSPLRRRFQPQIQIAETIIQWEDLSHDPSNAYLTIERGPAFKMLESSVLWIPDDHPILKDYSFFTTLPDPDGNPVMFSDRNEVDLLREHLIRGRQVWLVKTENGKRGINFEKTAAFDDARMVFVTQQYTTPLKKFCRRGQTNCIKNLNLIYNVSSFCNLKEEVEKSRQAAREEEERPRSLEHSGGLAIDRGLIDAFVGGNARLSLAIKEAGHRAHIARTTGLSKRDNRAGWSTTRKAIKFLRDPVTESVQWWKRMRAKSEQAILEAQFANCGPFMPPPLNPNPGEDACECGPVCRLNEVDPSRERMREQDIITGPTEEQLKRRKEILKHISSEPVPTYVDEMRGRKGKEILGSERQSTIRRKFPFLNLKHASELQHRSNTLRSVSPVTSGSITPKSKPLITWVHSNRMAPPPGCNHVLYQRKLPVNRYGRIIETIQDKTAFRDELQKIRWFMDLVDRGDCLPSDWNNPEKKVLKQWGPDIHVIFTESYEEFSRQESNDDVRKEWNKHYPLPGWSFSEVDLFPSPVLASLGSSTYRIPPPKKEGSTQIKVDKGAMARIRSRTLPEEDALPPPTAPRLSPREYPSFSTRALRRSSSKSSLQREEQDSLQCSEPSFPLDAFNTPSSLTQKRNSSESPRSSKTFDDSFVSFEDDPSPLTQPVQAEFSIVVGTSSQEVVLSENLEQEKISTAFSSEQQNRPDSPTLPSSVQSYPAVNASALLPEAMISGYSDQRATPTLEGVQSGRFSPTNPTPVKASAAAEISSHSPEAILFASTPQEKTFSTTLEDTTRSTHVTFAGSAGHYKSRASKDSGYSPVIGESTNIEGKGIEKTDWVEINGKPKGNEDA
jgi:hypothetical protein